jgi:nucleoside-diphosphate-sugar epimerase
VSVCVTCFIGTRFVEQAPPPPDKVWTEADWNMDSTIINSPYRLSKRLAEQAAFEFGREHGLDVVAINPSFIMGPPMSSRTDSTSVQHCISVSACCSPPADVVPQSRLWWHGGAMCSC